MVYWISSGMVDKAQYLLLDSEERSRLKRKLYEADFESVESLKGLDLNGRQQQTTGLRSSDHTRREEADIGAVIDLSAACDDCSPCRSSERYVGCSVICGPSSTFYCDKAMSCIAVPYRSLAARWSQLEMFFDMHLQTNNQY